MKPAVYVANVSYVTLVICGQPCDVSVSLVHWLNVTLLVNRDWNLQKKRVFLRAFFGSFDARVTTCIVTRKWNSKSSVTKIILPTAWLMRSLCLKSTDVAATEVRRCYNDAQCAAFGAVSTTTSLRWRMKAVEFMMFRGRLITVEIKLFILCILLFRWCRYVIIIMVLLLRVGDEFGSVVL